MTSSVAVSGGPASIAADCEDLLTIAGITGSTADRLLGLALALQGDLLDGGGVAAALDPVGAAHFEAALLSALDGPDGLTATVSRVEVVRVGLQVAAESYLAADRLESVVLPFVEAYLHTFSSGLATLHDLVSGRWSAAATDWLTENPYLADALITTAGLVRRTVAPGVSTTAALGDLYGDGSPVLTQKSTGAPAPPRSARDLFTSLAETNDGEHGEVSVQILTGVAPDGGAYRKVIVEIPGTKDWNVSQLTDPDVTNAGTNLRALAGERTTYEKGVIAALDAAGVRNDDDITLIGHSLGGVIAVNTARDLTARGRNVSHVITAGAPISSVARHLPSSVQVLAVENQGDIVPHLDGSPNPDRATLTTVTVHHDHRNVTANHDLDKSYLPGAADIDASDDPSVRAYLDGLAAQLGAGSVTAHSYVVTRTH